MLKKMVNNARIEFTIIPVDPMLIKSGHATVSGANMSFVSTFRSGKKDEPFIPGSSIKGMIRAYAEKICRTIRDKPVPVCLPYVEPGKEGTGEKHQASCGLFFEKKGKEKFSSSEIYKYSCPACRLFGSNGFAGRLSTSDAYITDDYKKQGVPVLEIRDGIGIDRITGGTAPGAKYDFEVLTRGEFSTTIEIRNFERWQFGLIALVLRDMQQGLIRIGFGKSRGLGRFKTQITNFKLSYYQNVKFFSGLQSLCSEEEVKQYGFFKEINEKQQTMPAPVKNGLRFEYDFTDNWNEIAETGVNDLVHYIKNIEWPKALETKIEGMK